MLNASTWDCNGSDSSINGRGVEFWHLPCTLLGVASSDLLTLGGYPQNEGHYTMARDASILSSLDVASPSSEPRELAI